MKIMHLMLACFYIDNYSYQENYLPKYHKEQGHEVEIVASLVTFDKNGNSTMLDGACKYQNEFGIPVTRLDYSHAPFSKRLRKYQGLKQELDRFHPDIIFCHGVQFADISLVKQYCTCNPDVKLFIDSHSDFSNSATNWVSKYIQHRIIWRHFAQQINPFVQKFYGVLPARVDFLINEYKLPAEKVELLVMGADDKCVKEASEASSIASVREKYHINTNDFLIVTGGKIDQWKTQTLLLMEAVQKIPLDNVKLIVFGSVTEELQPKVDALTDGDKIQYIGWLHSEDSYKYFAAADLVVFPGRHSVFWEQVAAQGIPMVVKYWAGTAHVDMGGNVKFLLNDNTEEIFNTLMEIISNADCYNKMKQVAVEKGMANFAYSDIAKRCIVV